MRKEQGGTAGGTTSRGTEPASSIPTGCGTAFNPFRSRCTGAPANADHRAPADGLNRRYGLAVRSLEKLRNAEREGQLPEFLFFWGHHPRRPGELGPWCLSQWYPSPFSLNGSLYATAEHFMMAEKARMFGDEKVLESILSTTDPRQAKSFGRNVRHFSEMVWETHRYDIVVRGNLAKFGQADALREYLCSTAGRVLVEASPVDVVWGIGHHANDESASTPSEWRGMNLLGFALMEVRKALCGS